MRIWLDWRRVMSDYDQRGLADYLEGQRDPTPEEMRECLIAYLTSMSKEEADTFVSLLTDSEVDRLYGETDAKEYI